MKTVLAIFFLSVQSSYSGNTESPATEETFDTVQFYASNGSNWRIKTYATDQDVHIWSLGDNVPDIVALARSNTEKHYGDVLSEGYIIETTEGLEGVRKELVKRGLSPCLEVTNSGAVFWAPEGSHYKTKSKPEK
jgi:hypothetical protein